MQDITEFLCERKELCQSRCSREEGNVNYLREALKEAPECDSAKEALQQSIKLQDRYSALLDFIEELQENM